MTPSAFGSRKVFALLLIYCILVRTVLTAFSNDHMVLKLVVARARGVQHPERDRHLAADIQ